METLDAFDRRFPDETTCRLALQAARWPDGVRCPQCGTDKVYALKSKPFYWLCKPCGNHRFSVISDTIFENTKKPLLIWFKVAYLMLIAKKGRSALEIHRTMYGDPFTADYHTTWYMCTRLRAAMRNQEWIKLMGDVEVDETYIGGSNKNRHASKKKAGKGTASKIPVIGAIARKGNVVCQMIENADTETLTKFVRKTVSGRVDLLATDEHSGYRYLKWAPYPHETIGHSQGEYVRGKVHTQTIESFWSLIKRGIMGNYHQVSKRYLPLYLAEFSFRFNNRKNPDIFSELLSRC
ncbi:MAG: IS1595 family transposase [Candidatus Binatus sp.]|uniref:IS1595 family transposase n=1 Tax=Candidatus Binatus sp. TaxID=2811406 RepID=UPI003C72FADC